MAVSGLRVRTGFAGRLLAAQALVLLAGAATTWLVASVVGPPSFRRHLAEAGVPHSTSETRHIEEAFSAALLISTSVALVAAVGAALAVSAYFSRRVRRSIVPVTEAAADIAAGSYDARVPDPGLGEEFVTLAATVNALAERLSSVERTRRRMLADLAHELRTPLATIEAHLEAVEDGVRELDASTIGVVRASTARLRRLAEDISAVSSAQERRLAIDRRPVDAGRLAAGVVAAAQDRFLAKGVDLAADLDCAESIEVDPDRIGQVLGNLLDNALRHTDPGGSVRVSCAGEGGWVRYRVTDSGEGIAAEHLPHVFDRFYRADVARDRLHGGSGIGLTIARALVEAHEGTIEAASPGPGYGATFTVRLPAAAGRPGGRGSPGRGPGGRGSSEGT